MQAHSIPNNSSLAQIFSKHNNNIHPGFITRLDRSSVLRKKLTFAQSFIYNIAILIVVFTTLAVALSQDLSNDLPQSLRLTLSISQHLVLVSAAFIALRTTSAPFFFGECRLRWEYGFRPAEVIIRRSPPESRSLDRSSERYWRAALRAIDTSTLYSNPRAMLAKHFWMMEYDIILDVYAALERDEFQAEDLEFTVWREQNGTWTAFELWSMHTIVSDEQEIALFKTFLTQQGKPQLLSAWEEVYESKTQSFPTSKKYNTMASRFSQEGIDVDMVWSTVCSHRPCSV